MYICTSKYTYVLIIIVVFDGKNQQEIFEYIIPNIKIEEIFKVDVSQLLLTIILEMKVLKNISTRCNMILT